MRTVHPRCFVGLSLLLSACAGQPQQRDFSPQRHQDILAFWELVPTAEVPFTTRFEMIDGVTATYTFTPPNPREWVIYGHGYLDHGITSVIMIRYFLSRGVGVVTFDLPGHGLSVGKRADIDDFSLYGDAWGRVLRQTQELYPRTAIGHSTGCAGLLDYTQRDGVILPERIVLIAPLVRNVFWELSRFAYGAFGWVTSQVPAIDAAASRDPTWVRRWREDPYTEKTVPLNWFRSLQVWEERTKGWKVVDGSRFFIMQGTADSVVDWRYNVPFLQEKYAGITVHWIEDGWHGLQYDHEPTRAEFYATLDAIFRF